MQYPATAFLACSALLGVALAGPHGYNKRPEHPSDSAWSSNADKTIKSLSQQTQRPSTKNRAVVNSADAAPSETEDLSLGLDDDGNPTSAWTPVVPEKTTKKTTSTKVTTSKSTPAPQPTKSTSSPSKTTTPASQPTKSQGGTAPPAGYGDHGKPSSSTSCKTGSTCRPTTKTVKSTITTPVEAISTWTSWEDQTITTSVITTFLSTKYITVTSTTTSPYLSTKTVPYDLTTSTVTCQTITTTIPTSSLSTCTETSTFPFEAVSPSECTETSTVPTSFVTSSPCPETKTVTRQQTSVTQILSTGSTCSKTSSCKVVPTTQVRPGGYGGYGGW